jgi:hypothetical protein
LGRGESNFQDHSRYERLSAIPIYIKCRYELQNRRGATDNCWTDMTIVGSWPAYYRSNQHPRTRARNGQCGKDRLQLTKGDGMRELEMLIYELPLGLRQVSRLPFW